MRAEQDSDLDMLSDASTKCFLLSHGSGLSGYVLDPGGTKGDTEEVREAQSMGTESWGRRWGRRGLVRGQGMKMGLVSQGQRRRGLQEEAGGCRAARRRWREWAGDPFRVEPFPSWNIYSIRSEWPRDKKRFCGRKQEKSLLTQQRVHTSGPLHWWWKHTQARRTREAAFLPFGDGMYL